MSSDTAEIEVAEGVSSEPTIQITDQAYEPTYEDAFPPLPAALTGSTSSAQATPTTWSKHSLRSTTVTQVC